MVRVTSIVLAVADGLSRAAADLPVGQTNVTCAATSDWAKNSLGQNPCVVAAQLAATSLNQSISLPALDGASFYYNNIPAPWSCNAPFYSLFAECSDCQGGSWQDWTDWTKNCTQVFDDFQGPVSDQTEIPPWSELTNVTQGTYDSAAAKLFALAPDLYSSSIAAAASSSAAAESASESSVFAASASSVAASLSSVSAASASSVSLASESSASLSSVSAAAGQHTSSPFPSATATADPDHASTPTATAIPQKKTHVGTIAGGVVGGLVALVLLALAALYLRKRSSDPALSDPAAPTAPQMERIDPPAAEPARLPYNPADPATFPPPASSTSYNPYSAGGSPAPYNQYGMPNPFATPLPTLGVHARPYSAAGRPHSGYTGAPEV